MYISSLLFTLDSQLILIKITTTPLILVRTTLFILCLHLIILFIFYLPFLYLVTKIQSFLFYTSTTSASVWLKYSIKLWSMNLPNTPLFWTDKMVCMDNALLQAVHQCHSYLWHFLRGVMDYYCIIFIYPLGVILRAFATTCFLLSP